MIQNPKLRCWKCRTPFTLYLEVKPSGATLVEGDFPCPYCQEANRLKVSRQWAERQSPLRGQGAEAELPDLTGLVLNGQPVD